MLLPRIAFQPVHRVRARILSNVSSRRLPLRRVFTASAAMGRTGDAEVPSDLHQKPSRLPRMPNSILHR